MNFKFIEEKVNTKSQIAILKDYCFDNENFGTVYSCMLSNINAILLMNIFDKEESLKIIAERIDELIWKLIKEKIGQG